MSSPAPDPANPRVLSADEASAAIHLAFQRIADLQSINTELQNKLDIQSRAQNATSEALVSHRDAIQQVADKVVAIAKAPEAQDLGGDVIAVIKHMYDWAQHFGMPPLPAAKPEPAPPPPPPPQPRGFDPFGGQRDRFGPQGG